MNEIELKDIIDKHGKWLRSEEGGQRANLRSADLSSANLSYANLRSADLSSADLRYADLRSADLRSADLSYANLSYANLSSADLRSADLSSADLRSADLRSADLSYANLSYANLSSADLREIKKDFFERLTLAKNEVAGLYDYLMRGKINGSSYEGECACFCGTVAKVAKESYAKLSSGLVPDASSPTERWFLAIIKGDTPQSNQVADVARVWIEEFAGANALVLPQYRLVSSAEFPEIFK